MLNSVFKPVLLSSYTNVLWLSHTNAQKLVCLARYKGLGTHDYSYGY